MRLRQQSANVVDLDQRRSGLLKSLFDFERRLSAATHCLLMNRWDSKASVDLRGRCISTMLRVRGQLDDMVQLGVN